MKGTLEDRLSNISLAAEPTEANLKRFFISADLARFFRFPLSTMTYFRKAGRLPPETVIGNNGKPNYRYKGSLIHEWITSLRRNTTNEIPVLWDLQTPLWTRKDLIDYLNVEDKIRLELVEKGELPYYEFGIGPKSVPRYSPFEIMYWLETLRPYGLAEIHSVQYQPPSPTEPLLDTAEIARRIKWRDIYISKAMRRGRMPGLKIKKLWKLRREEFRDWRNYDRGKIRAAPGMPYSRIATA